MTPVIGIYRSLCPDGVYYAQSTSWQRRPESRFRTAVSLSGGLLCPSCCGFGFVEAKSYAWIRLGEPQAFGPDRRLLHGLRQHVMAAHSIGRHLQRLGSRRSERHVVRVLAKHGALLRRDSACLARPLTLSAMDKIQIGKDGRLATTIRGGSAPCLMATRNQFRHLLPLASLVGLKLQQDQPPHKTVCGRPSLFWNSYSAIFTIGICLRMQAPNRGHQ